MSSSEESEPDQNESRDIEKLHQIWKGLKESKRVDRFSDKKSLLSVKEAIHQEEQKNLEVRLAMT
jgi:DNA-binding MltR family transcriptional regulator